MRICRLTASRLTPSSFAAAVRLRCLAAASKATRLLNGGSLELRACMTVVLRGRDVFSISSCYQRPALLAADGIECFLNSNQTGIAFAVERCVVSITCFAGGSCYQSLAKFGR